MLTKNVNFDKIDFDNFHERQFLSKTLRCKPNHGGHFYEAGHEIKYTNRQVTQCPACVFHKWTRHSLTIYIVNGNVSSKNSSSWTEQGLSIFVLRWNTSSSNCAKTLYDIEQPHHTCNRIWVRGLHSIIINFSDSLAANNIIDRSPSADVIIKIWGN